MPSWEPWVERPSSLIRRGGELQALKVMLQKLLDNSREYLMRVNICNQSISVQDSIS
jgi:hypothetical protein